jgi:hypothetical protein
MVPVLENGTPQDIIDAASRLGQLEPKTFPSIVRKFWGDRQEAAMKSSGGEIPQGGAGQWASDVAGSPGSPQRDRFVTTMKMVAMSHGKTEAEAAAVAAAAVDKVDALQTISRGRQGQGQVNVEEMQGGGGSNIFSWLGKALGVQAPLYGTAKWLDRVLQRHTYDDLAKALVSPEGVDRLLEIAKYNQKAQVVKQGARGAANLSAGHQAGPGDLTKPAPDIFDKFMQPGFDDQYHTPTMVQ